MTDSQVFADNLSTPNEEPAIPEAVATLVGPGRKYATIDDLAKGYLNADGFIGQLKTEQKELRETLEQTLAEKDYLQRIKPEEKKQPEPTTPQPDKTVTAETPSREDLASLVREVASEQRIQETESTNIRSVADELSRVYGDDTKANEAVKARAAELDMTVTEMADLAKRSPKMFFASMNIQPAHNAPIGTRSDVNAQALTNSNGGRTAPNTYKYYEELRVSNPTEYFKPEVQNRLHAEARKAHDEGRDFFARA